MFFEYWCVLQNVGFQINKCCNSKNFVKHPKHVFSKRFFNARLFVKCIKSFFIWRKRRFQRCTDCQCLFSNLQIIFNGAYCLWSNLKNRFQRSKLFVFGFAKKNSGAFVLFSNLKNDFSAVQKPNKIFLNCFFFVAKWYFPTLQISCSQNCTNYFQFVFLFC